MKRSMIVWFYSLYQKIKQWYYSIDDISYYMISKSGKQIPVFSSYSDKDDPIDGFLTIYNKNGNYKYKFTPNFTKDNFEIPTYKILNLMVTIETFATILDVNEYAIVSNTLFTPTFNNWLCRKHNIPLSNSAFVLLCDENADIHTIQTIHFEKDKYIIT
jgi:hypothetical protein